MKYILLFFFTSIIATSGFAQEKLKSEEKPQKKQVCKKEVYICNSTASKAYHLSKECGALQKCKDTIRKICKEKAAKKYGRILCGYEKE